MVTGARIVWDRECEQNHKNALLCRHWLCISTGAMKMKINFIGRSIPRSGYISKPDSLWRSIGAVVLLFAISGLSIAATANLHLHVLPDGRIVVHSHPGSGERNSGRHDHSSSDYLAWGAFAKILQVDLISPLEFTGYVTSPVWWLEPAAISGPSSRPSASISPRAPPDASGL